MFKKKSILLIDDDPTLHPYVDALLQDSICQLQSFLSGQGIEEHILNDMPDLILLDIELPEGSGQDILQKLKQYPESQAIPVLMLTSHNEEEYVHRAIKSGACGYILKPFTASFLVMELEKHLDCKLFPAA